MLASKQYYKSFPELRPAKKEKKQKVNYDSISYLQKTHGHQHFIQMMIKDQDPEYHVNYRNGKITKKRQYKNIPVSPPTTQEPKEETKKEVTPE